MKRLLYFGCWTRPGHYLYNANGQTVTDRLAANAFGINERIFNHLDGMFINPKASECKYTVTLHDTTMILAWPDFSVDHRPGSHSTFIGQGFQTPEELILHAAKEYPNIIQRQRSRVMRY
jgi:hypothetical protein